MVFVWPLKGVCTWAAASYFYSRSRPLHLVLAVLGSSPAFSTPVCTTVSAPFVRYPPAPLVCSHTIAHSGFFAGPQVGASTMIYFADARPRLPFGLCSASCFNRSWGPCLLRHLRSAWPEFYFSLSSQFPAALILVLHWRGPSPPPLLPLRFWRKLRPTLRFSPAAVVAVAPRVVVLSGNALSSIE